MARLSGPIAVCTWCLLYLGCGSGKSEGESLGGGPETDARLISDVRTWRCQNQSESTNFDGVYAQVVTLEYAPDALQTLSLPTLGGCSADLDMFPDGAGDGGSDIPTLSEEPTWETAIDNGHLSELGDGF